MPPSPTRDRAVSLRGLTKEFEVPERDPGLWGAARSLLRPKTRRVVAVKDLSLSIEEGELVGFLGANGAGKTTTLKMLSGLLHPTHGEASVLGHVPWRREPEFQKAMTLVMGQRTQLWWEIPARETFRLNAAIYGLSDAEYRRNLSELVSLLELADCLSVPVKKLSLGQRMRAELAAALLHRPRLLLLDEPTLGLDVVMQKKVRQFIADNNKRRRATTILTSHNMGDVVELCRRVVIIDRGALLYDGPLDRLVERYAASKVIRVVLERSVPLKDLEAIGRVVENGSVRAVIEVPRREVSRAAAALLKTIPVADLTIEEPPIDDIVRQIFLGPGAQVPEGRRSCSPEGGGGS